MLIFCVSNTVQTNTKIKQLSDTTISRIAAGEVIERPASVVKELVENSIDAQANIITVYLEEAGKNLIKIIDNGFAMAADDLSMAVQRHTTSKLNEADIMDISTFGFRGEALPSIGSISRMKILSRTKNSDLGSQIDVIGGEVSEITKVPSSLGTTIEIRDLFFATPARLKFLRTDRTELNACIDVIKKIAIANPNVSFKFFNNEKNILHLNASNRQTRVQNVLGNNFTENSTKVDYQLSDIHVEGYTSLPTYNRASPEDQYLYVNNRPIKDKIVNIAVKVAYKDYIANGRYPVTALFIKLNPKLVDVNVHPAKAEVRFHDVQLIRQALIKAIHEALAENSHKVSSTHADNMLNSFKTEKTAQNTQNFINPSQYIQQHYNHHKSYSSSQANEPEKEIFRPDITYQAKITNIPPQKQNFTEHDETKLEYRLGAATAQLHKNYIISQTQKSIIIIDQHAAHERLTYEALKQELAKEGIVKQRLLIPEIVHLSDEKKADVLEQFQDKIAKLGLTYTKFDDKSVIVNEVPHLIKEANLNKLINDMADHLADFGENVALDEVIESVTETYACHHSIRSGRVLNTNEMNALLRQMEEVPFSGQCNHGRPTYVELKLSDIERLFGRT